MRYFQYSKYLEKRYGQKVYKLPVNILATCPNRDGNLSKGGCTFCGDVAAGFELLDVNLSVEEQLQQNKAYIKKKYGANQFIAYFQNYTNTYLPLEEFKRYILEAIVEDVVEISISTRPDSIDGEILDFLEEVKTQHDIEISIELGLQTVNYKTLNKINRGHSLAEFIDAVRMIKEKGFLIAVHMILNLPWDEEDDIIEGAKVLSALKVDFVKLHSLYILKDTVLGNQYLNDEFELISVDDYVKRAVLFLRYLNPEIVVQRLLARAPKEKTLFCNWDMSWWKIKDMIDLVMEEKDFNQGDLFDYLNGKTLKRFR